MKVFKINDGGDLYWLSANSKEEAIARFSEETGVDDIESCTELPSEEWGDKIITYHDVPDDDGEPVQVTFLEYMKTATEVEIFCSTDWE